MGLGAGLWLSSCSNSASSWQDAQRAQCPLLAAESTASEGTLGRLDVFPPTQEKLRKTQVFLPEKTTGRLPGNVTGEETQAWRQESEETGKRLGLGEQPWSGVGTR